MNFMFIVAFTMIKQLNLQTISTLHLLSLSIKSELHIIAEVVLCFYL